MKSQFRGFHFTHSPGTRPVNRTAGAPPGAGSPHWAQGAEPRFLPIPVRRGRSSRVVGQSGKAYVGASFSEDSIFLCGGEWALGVNQEEKHISLEGPHEKVRPISTFIIIVERQQMGIRALDRFTLCVDKHLAGPQQMPGARFPWNRSPVFCSKRNHTESHHLACPDRTNRKPKGRQPFGHLSCFNFEATVGMSQNTSGSHWLLCRQDKGSMILNIPLPNKTIRIYGLDHPNHCLIKVLF